MKKLVLALLFLLVTQFAFSQVGINTTDPKAQLDIQSSNQAAPSNTDGILIPKIDTFPAANPTALQQGMMVYLTTVSAGKQPGFYYWDNVTVSWKGLGGSAASSGWDLTGNAGTNSATNFIGTTDATDVVFRRDNVISGKIGMANTSFGRSSLNPLSSGIYNSTFGLSSLMNNTSGNSNSAFGNYALANNTTGNSNTGFGSNAMYTNSTGRYNSAVGSDALEYNSTGNNNSATGYFSLYHNTIGNNNTANGMEALRENTTGGFNTAVGSRALHDNQTGAINTAIGDDALSKSDGAYLNVAIGGSTMLENTSGSWNTAIGSGSLRNNTTANENTAIGYEALYQSTGSDNTALGFQAGQAISSGSGNISIGSGANVPSPTTDNQMSIGDVVYGADMGDTALGKIGIGVPVPTEKLEVAGKTKTTDLQVTNGAGIGKVLTSDAVGNASWQNAGSGAADADFYEVGTTTPPDAITDAMFHSGNVGIGNNNPTYKLDVDETASGKIYAMRVRHSNPVDGSTTSGIQSTISGGSISSGIIQGVSTSITPNSGTSAKGLRNLIGGTSGADVTGVDNSISTSGVGSRTGVSNSFPGTGTGITYGMYNSFSNPNAVSLGVSSNFTAAGIRDKTGVDNDISNSTGGFHTGIKNTFTNNNGAIEETGVYSKFTGSSVGNIRGIYNEITNSGSGNIQYGLYNNINGSGGLKRYGVENTLMGASAGTQTGTENYISVTGNGTHYGNDNYLIGTGTGSHYGTNNWLTGSGSGEQYGVSNYIDNLGIGDKYGVYSHILPSAGGLHYGVYSNATKANSYAGYFLGRFSIGTTTANNYILPLTRGTVNQIMQTDATGNVTWVSSSTIASGTLDQAYDFSGAGLGRTITADAGAVTINGTDGLVSTGTLGSGVTMPAGAGTRMVWNPRKAAFRAGYVNGTQWDDSNVGQSSTAFGSNTIASGNFSTAFGYGSIASGFYSTAFGGGGSVASGQNSTAFGYFQQAIGSSSTAFGQENIAQSFGETVLGIGATNYTPSTNGVFEFRTANATDRLFVIGNAIDADGDNAVDSSERSNALVVLKNGNTGIGAAPLAGNKLYTFSRQLTAAGDGQSAIYGHRDRDSQNDGTGYGVWNTNQAIQGYNYQGDLYSFGVTGFSYNDFSRSGGVFGSYVGGTYWSSLGYKNSASTGYGVYATATLATGTGRMANSSQSSIGGGFYGGIIGSWSKGEIGNMNSGTLFASYNSGDEYTSGKQIEIVATNNGKKAAYTVTSTEAIVYKKGKITLVNGTARIDFDSDYAALLGDIPVVTTTPMGQCNGIYIESIDKSGFTVKELNNGTSNVQISWIAVGDRIDANKTIQRDVLADDFDKNINEVMFNENNKEDNAKAIWSDGNKINFGKLPENLIEKPVKTENK
ncbi:hypothetical protein [Flavobacterium sp.]|uniref:beta strand repeat-containing protein n=1 Tax=Flavobacterium sp. TaxID=239 RepID=UPI0026182A56|nr:hypothetical protein [Flavobacterium sp.]